MNIIGLQEEVRAYAKEIGIDKIGFTTAAPFRELKNRLIRQQELGYQSGFEESDVEKRTNPSLLLDEPESIIAIAIAYPSRMEESPKGKKVKDEGFFAGLLGDRLSYRSKRALETIRDVYPRKSTYS